jgi:hypothetical protein
LYDKNFNKIQFLNKFTIRIEIKLKEGK